MLKRMPNAGLDFVRDVFGDDFEQLMRHPMQLLTSGVNTRKKEDNNLVVTFNVAGVDEANVSAQVVENYLEVSANQDEYQYEYSFGIKGLNLDTVQTELKNGILKFTFELDGKVKERKLFGK